MCQVKKFLIAEFIQYNSHGALFIVRFHQNHVINLAIRALSQTAGRFGYSQFKAVFL